MAKVHVTNNTDLVLALPRPLTGTMQPREQREFTLSVSEMETSPDLVKALNDGILVVTVAEDPTVPDNIEEASLLSIIEGGGLLVWDQTREWAAVFQKIAEAGGNAIVLVVGTDTGDPLPLTPGADAYDFSGVYFLGVPGLSGQARIAFQSGVVLAVGALLRSKDVAWTWDAAMPDPIPAYSLSLVLDGGGIIAPSGAMACLFQTSNWALNSVRLTDGAVLDGTEAISPVAIFQAVYAGLVPPRPIREPLRGPSPIRPPRPRPWPPLPPPPIPPRHGIDFMLLESNLLGSVVNTPSGFTRNTVTADADAQFDLTTAFTSGANVDLTLLNQAVLSTYNDAQTPPWGVGTVQAAFDAIKSDSAYPQRMSTAARTAYTPNEGAVVYDLDLHALYVMTDTGWAPV